AGLVRERDLFHEVAQAPLGRDLAAQLGERVDADLHTASVDGYSRTTTTASGWAASHARIRSCVSICCADALSEPRKETSTSSSAIWVTTTFVSNANSATRPRTSPGLDSLTRNVPLPPPHGSRAGGNGESLLRTVAIDHVARHRLPRRRGVDV